jgi:hypothetical protein
MITTYRSRVEAETSTGGSASLYFREVKDSVDPKLREIARRVADQAQVPLAALEPVSITKYTYGQHYGLHGDSVYFNRSKTVLIYLCNVASGGETVFPFAALPSGVPADPSEDLSLKQACNKTYMSENGRTVLLVRPLTGAAVLWENTMAGEVNERARHGSCPVTLGEKWVMQFWINEAEMKGFWGNETKNHEIEFRFNETAVGVTTVLQTNGKAKSRQRNQQQERQEPVGKQQQGPNPVRKPILSSDGSRVGTVRNATGGNVDQHPDGWCAETLSQAQGYLRSGNVAKALPLLQEVGARSYFSNTSHHTTLCSVMERFVAYYPVVHIVTQMAPRHGLHPTTHVRVDLTKS